MSWPHWDGTFWIVKAESGFVELCPVGPGFGGLKDISTAFRRAKLLAGWKRDELPAPPVRLGSL